MKQNKYDKRYGYFPGFFKNTYKTAINFLPIKKNEKILEIGCGKGTFLSNLSEYSKNVFGIDVNEAAIKSLNNDKCTVMNAENLNFKDMSFDKIYALHVIEHVPDFKTAISEMHRVLKRNGHTILVYPLEPIRGISEFINSIKVYRHPFAGHKLHLHRLHPNRIRKVAEEIGFKVFRDGLFFADFGPYPQAFSILKKVS